MTLTQICRLSSLMNNSASWYLIVGTAFTIHISNMQSHNSYRHERLLKASFFTVRQIQLWKEFMKRNWSRSLKRGLYKDVCHCLWSTFPIYIWKRQCPPQKQAQPRHILYPFTYLKALIQYCYISSLGALVLGETTPPSPHLTPVHVYDPPRVLHLPETFLQSQALGRAWDGTWCWGRALSTFSPLAYRVLDTRHIP